MLCCQQQLRYCHYGIVLCVNRNMATVRNFELCLDKSGFDVTCMAADCLQQEPFSLITVYTVITAHCLLLQGTLPNLNFPEINSQIYWLIMITKTDLKMAALSTTIFSCCFVCVWNLSLTSRKQHRLRWRVQVTEDLRKLLSEELQDLYCSRNNIIFWW
jgi:hypothetical protein